MVEDLKIDYSRMRMQINGSMRGDDGIEPPVLVNDSDMVTIVDRKYFGDLVTGFGLVERELPFPESYKEIDSIALQFPGKNFEVYELLDGTFLGLATRWLKASLQFAAGPGGYEFERFALYHPSGSTGEAAAPFALVTDHTPSEFVINRLFESKTQFVSEYGAGACPECELMFDSHFVDCPDCGHRPESVRNNIELIQDEHAGVVFLIAPIVDFSPSTQAELDTGDVPIRRPLELPDPEIDVIESPGLQEGT